MYVTAESTYIKWGKKVDSMLIDVLEFCAAAVVILYLIQFLAFRHDRNKE
jgi:hypothetical protein